MACFCHGCGDLLFSCRRHPAGSGVSAKPRTVISTGVGRRISLPTSLPRGGRPTQGEISLLSAHPQAQGIAKVAKAAGIERESLYRALSAHGNPRLSTLVAVTKAIGLRLTVELAS